MGRSRYVITEPDRPHFLTRTVLEWLPVFTRPATVQIVLDSWRYLNEHDRLKLHAYVILENHLHFVAQAPRLDNCVQRFKSFTARQIIDYLKEQRVGCCWRNYIFPNSGIKWTGNINSGKKVAMPN